MRSIVATPPAEPGSVAGRLSTAARVCAAATAVLAAVVLLGWVLHLPWATRIGDGVTMKPTPPLPLTRLAAGWSAPPVVARVAVALAGAIAAVTLGEVVFGVDRGIDGWITDATSGGPHDARMATSTAAALLALAVGRLVPLHDRRRRRLAEVLAFAVVVTAMLALLGHLYHVRSLYSTSRLSAMALPTASALLLLGCALLLTVPGGFVAWLVDGDDAGAVLMRRVLPVALVVLPTVGYLRLLGQRAGLYGTDLGLAITTVSAMALVVGTTGYTARHLRRVDETRAGALAALQVVNVDLEQRVAERAAQLDAERGLSALLRDRERIAADVHDLVIQRLYAVALTLDAAAGRSPDPAVVASAVDGIDEAMQALRGTIFELRRHPVADEVVATLDEIVASAATVLPSTPEVALRGDPGRLPEPIAADLLAVLREAVSNAVRHAHANHLRIELDVSAAEVTLTVADDGGGIDPGLASTSGLRNMQERAERRGGRCRWRPTDPHGTTVMWQVPLPPARPEDAGPTRQSRLMAAMQRVGRAASAGADPLAEVATALCDLVDADCLALVVDEDGERLRVALTDGFSGAADPRGLRIDRAGTLVGHVLASGAALRVDDVRANPTIGATPAAMAFGPALVVPLRGSAGVHGAISLARLAGRGPFSVDDEELAMTLVTHVALALDLGPAHGVSRPPLPVGS